MSASAPPYELFEDEANRTGRVLVIHIPGRPKGKLYKFEDVPLMRVGEELKVMPDDVIRDILLENENDFSAEICPAATLDDLDAEAIEILKRKYAAKQRNTHFLTLDHTQILSDLGLIAGGQLTYAALILVGKASALSRLLPQAKIVLEYRHDTNAIPYNNRTEYATCFFKTADRLWADINLRNDKIDISDGLYLLNLPLYNEEVVREAVNNAIAHRDYRCQSEIFVLQSPEQLIVKNAGGFPRGVNLQNLLSVCSTPRNRLLADVLAKTGVVERSGQGIDKIVKNTLSEGKKMPDYSHSDDFGVELHLSSEIEDVAFALFLEAMQKELPEEQRLSVFEIVALNQIRKGNHANLPTDTLQSLLKKGMIEKRGRTKGTHYVLSKTYYEYSGNEGRYSKESSWNKKQAMVVHPRALRAFQTRQNERLRGRARIPHDPATNSHDGGPTCGTTHLAALGQKSSRPIRSASGLQIATANARTSARNRNGRAPKPRRVRKRHDRNIHRQRAVNQHIGNTSKTRPR